MCYCKVGYCRFPFSHVTKGHKCGKCGLYGHGDFECNNITYHRERLETYYSDTMPENLQCSVEDCDSKTLHATNAHHCPSCNSRSPHTIQNCPNNNSSNTHSVVNTTKTYNLKCPLCRVDNVVVNPRKIFGLNDECCICYDNKVEILLPTCYHCCICMECLEKDQI